MKNFKTLGLLIILFISSPIFAQGIICDDFTDLTLFPTATYGDDDLVGYSQDETQAITCGVEGSVWLNYSEPGVYGVGPVMFDFDGSNQTARFEMFGFLGQFDQMGFSVNGSSMIYLDDSFPMTVSGVEIDIDLSPADIGDWEYFYLTFSGEINDISHELFESSVTELCVEPALVTEDGCDNFLDTEEWYLDEEFNEDDILGYTQDGTYAVTCSDGYGYVNTFGEVGISIGTGIVDFDFSGTNQSARFTVYHLGYDENMGFSVNGSLFTYFDATFPLVIDGITVDLDTSPADPDMGDDIWGYLSYLTFTGELDEVSIYALEGGITELCVEDLDEVEEGCDNFLDEDEWSMDYFDDGELLGYTQGGTYAITSLDAHGNINEYGNVGISIGEGAVEFDFSGDNQEARFLIYHNGIGFEQFGFSVNGEAYSYLEDTFPMVVDGVTIDFDTSPADADVTDDYWGDVSYLIFTGEISEIAIYAVESGILELCVEPIEIDNSGLESLSQSQVSIYPNPTSHYLRVDSEEILEEITIYSLSGQEMMTQLVGEKNAELNLIDLVPGMYLIKITEENGSETIEKLIRK